MATLNIFEIFLEKDTLLLILAALLGSLIGLEREFAGKDPSLRTFSMISLGACIFTVMSVDAVVDRAMGDPGRIAAQVVTGIGFLGAGVIFRSEKRVSGLTTAALMWLTAGIGMAVGFERIDLAITGTLIAVTILYGLRAIHVGLDAVGATKPHKSGKNKIQEED